MIVTNVKEKIGSHLICDLECLVEFCLGCWASESCWQLTSAYLLKQLLGSEDTTEGKVRKTDENRVMKGLETVASVYM